MIDCVNPENQSLETECDRFRIDVEKLGGKGVHVLTVPAGEVLGYHATQRLEFKPNPSDNIYVAGLEWITRHVYGDIIYMVENTKTVRLLLLSLGQTMKNVCEYTKDKYGRYYYWMEDAFCQDTGRYSTRMADRVLEQLWGKLGYDGFVHHHMKEGEQHSEALILGSSEGSSILNWFTKNGNWTIRPPWHIRIYFVDYLTIPRKDIIGLYYENLDSLQWTVHLDNYKTSQPTNKRMWNGKVKLIIKFNPENYSDILKQFKMSTTRFFAMEYEPLVAYNEVDGVRYCLLTYMSLEKQEDVVVPVRFERLDPLGDTA